MRTNGAATKSQMEARIVELVPLVSLVSRGELVSTYCKKWNLTPRMVDGYLAEARKRLAAQFAADIETEAGIAKARLERLLSRAETKGDIGSAIAAQKELTKLMGLAAPEKVEHSVSPELTEWLKLRRGNQPG
jgi:hypothetical protein